jgi:LuxR family quorum sensing-dependent transcriptional regulator
MQLTSAAFEFIELLDRKSDIASVSEAFQALIRKYGMACFTIGNVTQPKLQRDDRLWATTSPREWLDHFRARNYIAVDPVLNQILLRNEPVRWRDTLKGGDDCAARILGEASQFGMHDGLALPVYNRDGLTIAITIGTDRYELSSQDEAMLHLASLYFQAKLEQLRLRLVPRFGEPKMTPRERECLSWVAAGKTDWEISQILNIAEQTVHEYVQNALIKLKATTRAQAVATAIFTKQIMS